VGLWQYVLGRFLTMIPMLAAVTLVVFLVSQLLPVDPLAVILPIKALNNPEARQRAIERWGLDKSLPEQYLTYLWNTLHGDLGTSFVTKQPVREDLQRFVPATGELALAALLFAVGVGLPLGVIAGIRAGGWVDHVARAIALLGASMPPFWSGLMALFLFYAVLRILPGPGRIDPRMISPEPVTGLLTIDSLIAGDGAAFVNAVRHLILPAVILGWYPLAVTARLTRASLLEVLGMDYIRTARAKGLHPRRVMLVHALRNALIPTVTMLAFSAAVLLTGAITVEAVFAWPGIGSYLVQAAMNLDYPALMSTTILVAVIFMSSRLVVDLLYGVIDPRIRET
jgi:peptide/nickel transport system permease protein